MLPLEALELRLREALQLSVDIPRLPPLIIPLHPQDLERRDDEDQASGR